MPFTIRIVEEGGWRGRYFEAACLNCGELSAFAIAVPLPHLCARCSTAFPGLAGRVLLGREPRPAPPIPIAPRLPKRMIARRAA